MAKTSKLRCIDGTIGNKEVSYQYLIESSALATALVPSVGYAQVSAIVRSALAEGRRFLDIVVEKGLLTEGDMASVIESPVRNGTQ